MTNKSKKHCVNCGSCQTIGLESAKKTEKTLSGGIIISKAKCKITNYL